MRWLITICIILLVSLIGLWKYLEWGRQYIYQESSVNFQFPGFGKQFGESQDQFILIDNNNIETRVMSGNNSNFDNSIYDITYIPHQTFLGYSVGYFKYWEDIDNSDDKYISIQDSQEGVTRYRVVFKPDVSVLDKWSETSIQVECVGLIGCLKTESLAHININDIDFDKIQKSIKIGDAVTIIPQRIRDSLSARDENGFYITQGIILRRSFGFNELKLELML